MSALIIWLVGLFTLVPGSIYYSVLHASFGKSVFLVVFALLWIFAYWAVVGPITTFLKVRSIVKTLRALRSEEGLMARIKNEESAEAVIDMISEQLGVPRMLAEKAYQLLMKKKS